jgi:hypothetical protein
VIVSATSAGNAVLGEIVAPDGSVVASGSYDTPSGGDYSVRVCEEYTSMDPAQVQYTAEVGTGPAGQPAIPRQQPSASASSAGAVLGATTTLTAQASGRGAVKTRAGLAWFTVSTLANGTANLTVYDPVHHQRRVMKGMNAVVAAHTVRLTGSGVTLVVVDNGNSDRVKFTSKRFKASGKVVRGGFDIIA